MRTLTRLVTFEVARWDGSELFVRTALAPSRSVGCAG